MTEKRLQVKASNFWIFGPSSVTFPSMCNTLKPELLADVSEVQNSITVPSEIKALTERFLKIFVRQISLPPHTAEAFLSFLTD